MRTLCIDDVCALQGMHPFICSLGVHFLQGWVLSADARLRFEFDGDALEGERDTPASLGMEDGDKIEVHIL